MNRVGKILVVIAVIAATVATFIPGVLACPGALPGGCADPTIVEPTGK